MDLMRDSGVNIEIYMLDWTHRGRRYWDGYRLEKFVCIEISRVLSNLWYQRNNRVTLTLKSMRRHRTSTWQNNKHFSISYYGPCSDQGCEVYRAINFKQFVTCIPFSYQYDTCTCMRNIFGFSDREQELLLYALWGCFTEHLHKFITNDKQRKTLKVNLN